jgi:hypothetical protein
VFTSQIALVGFIFSSLYSPGTSHLMVRDHSRAVRERGKKVERRKKPIKNTMP